MLGFIKFPGVSADGPGDPYYWPVGTGDVLIWEHQQEGGVITYEKWEFVERNWTELIPGNYSETIWFNVYEWNSTYGTWDRIPYLGYPETRPAPICSANWTYQTWDHTGLGDYISGEPYAFVNGIDPVLNAFFVPRHYEASGENWYWINQTYFYAMVPAPEINSDPYTNNKLQIYNTSQGNFVVEYFNYSVYESYMTPGRAGALLKDHATIYPNGTIQERMLLRRLIDQFSNVDYSYDAEIPSKSSLTWGVKKGDKLIWNNTLSDTYTKWEIVGFELNASANREYVLANGFSWISGQYYPTPLSSNLPTQLPQIALAGNCTWQSFNLQGNGSHPIWGYPYGLATNSHQALPLQGGTVNMSWFDVSLRELLIMSYGAFPADFSTTINGLTYTVRNTTAGVDVFQFNYTSKGVLSYYIVRSYDGTPMVEMILVRGPGLVVTIPPAPVYQWGIQEGDVLIWRQQAEFIDTYLKSEILGFEDELLGPGLVREIVHDLKFNWDQETGQWDDSTGMTSPPDLVQIGAIANLTWQYFEFFGPGSGVWGWGYPYGAAITPGGMPLLNSLYLPLQGGVVNMSWFSSAYQAFYTFMGITGCSFAVDGLTFTVTNTTSSVVREKYIFNAMGVMEYYRQRDWDNSLIMEFKIVSGVGFPSTPPPSTKLSWGVAPRDEIVWGLGLDPESGTILGQMKWNISYIELLEVPPINFYREAIYANATKYNSASGEWETIVATMSSTPPEVPQPMVWANTTWQLFPWNIAEMTPQYMMGYPFGIVGSMDIPLFNSIPVPIYNEMIVPLQGGNVNMSWIDESWHNLFTAFMGVYPPDWQSSIVGNCLKITNTTSTVVQLQMNYTSNGILELFHMRSWDNILMLNYTLFSAPGYVPPVDLIPPSITILSPTPYQVLGNATPGFQVTITDPNLDKTWYNLGGSNFTFTGSIGTLDAPAWAAQGNGTVGITFYANDTLGHQSELMITVRKDIVPPTVTILVPTSFYDSPDPPLYSISITEPNRHTIWYTLDGGLSNYTSGSTFGTISTTAWAACLAGSVTITFYVNDTARNWASDSVTVTKRGPALTVNSPVPDSFHHANVPTYSVTVASQDHVCYSFNGGVTNYTITESTTPGTYTGSFDATAWQNLPNGTYVVTFAANDSADYWAIVSVTIHKDIIPPFLMVGQPAANAWFGATPPSIIAAAMYYQYVGYTLDGVNNFTFTPPGPVAINQAAWNARPDGSVAIMIFANDIADNWNITVVTVRKDTTLPSISITAPTASGTFETAPPFTLSITEANVNQQWYTLNAGTTTYVFTGNSGTIDATAWAALPDGKVTIRFYVSDQVGNVKYQEVTVNKGKPAEFPWMFVIIGAAAGVGVIGAVLVLKKGKSRSYTPSSSGTRVASTHLEPESSQVLEKPGVEKPKPAEVKKKPKQEPLPRKKFKEPKAPKAKKGKQKGFWSNLPTESSSRKK